MDNSDKKLKNRIKFASSANLEFEKLFLSVSLEQQIQHCDNYELVWLFRKWLPDHQPILEAGCGSGRWIVWFNRQGWQAAGLDWSSLLQDRAIKTYPGIRFDTGDMRNMPYRDCQFGSLISLGAVEHSMEGPVKSLIEFHRVLKNNSVAIITVPFLGPIRKISRFLASPVKLLKQISHIRKIFHKPTGKQSYQEAKQGILSHYSADFVMSNDGWTFFQYHFSKKQMRAFISETNFKILDEFVEFPDEGILHNFGKIAGKYNYEQGKVSFTWIGRMLRIIIPNQITGNMLCYVLRKSDDKSD